MDSRSWPAMTTKVRDETNVSTTDLGALFTGEPVVVAYLFGSQARGDAGPLSDVDVAILLEGLGKLCRCACG